MSESKRGERKREGERERERGEREREGGGERGGISLRESWAHLATGH